MFRSRVLVVMAVVLCGFVSGVGAAEKGAATVSLFETPPKVDGTIRPGEWDGALRIQGFYGLGRGCMQDKVSASWLGYTRERLFIAVASELPPDGKLRAMEMERAPEDTLYGAGGIELWIDANRGQRSKTQKQLPYVQFISNASGAVFDKKYGLAGKPPSVAWDGDWEVGNDIHESTDEKSPIQSENGIWVIEVSVPFKDLGLEKDPVGQTIGCMVGRNWKRRRGGQMSWFPHSGFYSNWGAYPTIRLTEDEPSVQIVSLGENFFKSHLQLQARIHNPTDRSRKVHILATATSSDMPSRKDDTTLTLKPNGYTPYEFEVKSFHEHARHKLHFVVKDVDADTPYLDYTMPWRKPGRAKWRTEEAGPEPKKAVRLAYYPSYGFFRITADPREVNLRPGSVQHADITVSGPGGEEMLSKSMNWESVPATQRFDIGTDLAPGEYTVEVRLKGYDHLFTRKFQREYFVWEGNRLGVTKKVYPPFKPIKRDGNDVSVVMRRYTQEGLGLWTSVRARGNDLGSEMLEVLAGPVSLKVNDGAVLKGQGQFTATGNQKTVYRGNAAHPAVSVDLQCITHYDGAMRVEMTLRPGEAGEELDALWLEIPVREEVATLFHATETGLRNNPAGGVPAGDGAVWDSKNVPSSGWYGNFKPYVWAGGVERGICWFADNDRGWVLDVNPQNPDQSVPSQELIRRDGQVVIRVNMIQKPVTIDEPRNVVFGLMATPGKPMPRNWRNIFFRQRPVNSRSLHWMAAQYWGSPTVMYSKLPIDQDTSVLSALQAQRLGAGNWGRFMKAWKEKHLSGDISDKTYKSKKKVTGLLSHAARISRGASGFLTVYWEEYHATHGFHPEDEVFGDEWGRHNYPDTYLDFAVWCGAEFIRRGMGLYFDNTFPKRGTDPVTTTAYRLPNGRIQPSAGMWRQREYLRRIWVLHQQLAPEATKPIMMLHMTNTHVAPYMVFNMSNLDLEWLFGSGTAQSKYPADLLRAETLGLQTGNVPVSLSARGGGSRHFGAMMVHEIRVKARGKLLDKLAEFGYTQSDARIYNYWDPNPPLITSDSECKWLMVKHHGELMVLFCTWNPKDTEVKVNLKLGDIGVQAGAARDVESEASMRVEKGSFRFTMPGHGVRMFHIHKND